MDTQLPSPTAAAGLDLESRAARIERFLDRNKLLVIVLLSVVYFAGSMLRARGKPFWFDEIVTLLPAQEASFHNVLEGARGIEFGPAGATVVGYVVNKIAGSGEIAFRIPAMIGFWTFCLCLFGFVARRAGVFFALGAMVLPFATFGESYSIEARSYPLVLGCCGLALYSWQSAAEGKRRGVALVVLALSIGAAILLNYYAVFILMPLAAGEAVRSLKIGKVDWPVWLALLVGALSLGSLIVYGQGLQVSHPWSVAQRHDYLGFYMSAFAKSLWFFIPALVLTAAWLMLGGDREKPLNVSPGVTPASELAAAALLLLLPVAAITVALLVPPHTFIERYGIPAIGGFALLSSMLAAYFAGGRSAVGLAFAVAAFFPFAFAMGQGRSALKSPFEGPPMLGEAARTGPVVITDSVTYLQNWYYAPAEIRSHLILLADEDLWLKYAHTTQFMEDFRRYGVPMMSYRELAAAGKPFRLYLTPGFGSWLPQKVLDDGGQLEVLKREEGQELLLVHPK